MVYMRAGDNKWVRHSDWTGSDEIHSDPLNAYINGKHASTTFIKSSDIYYSNSMWLLSRHTFHLKCEEEWYSLDYDEDDNDFFVRNDSAPGLGLYKRSSSTI